MSEETDRQAEQLSEEARTFVEDFAFSWGAAGNPRMDGRVLGLLLIVDRPFLSSAQIAEMLGASAGAVTPAPRRSARRSRSGSSSGAYAAASAPSRR